MPTFLTQSISCHFASSECHYIDVKNTTQEHLEKELQEMVCKKYNATSVELKVRLGSVPFVTNRSVPFPKSLMWQIGVLCYAYFGRSGCTWQRCLAG